MSRWQVLVVQVLLQQSSSSVHPVMRQTCSDQAAKHYLILEISTIVLALEPPDNVLKIVTVDCLGDDCYTTAQTGSLGTLIRTGPSSPPSNAPKFATGDCVDDNYSTTAQAGPLKHYLLLETS